MADHVDHVDKQQQPAIESFSKQVPSGNLTKLLKIAIVIVSFRMKNGDFP